MSISNMTKVAQTAEKKRNFRDLKLVVLLWKSAKSGQVYTNSSNMACSTRGSLLALNYSSVIPQGL